MSLKINTVETGAPTRVDFLWPKPPAKPQLEGFVMAHFKFHSQDKLDEFQAQVEAGELSDRDHFKKMVPQIDGMQNRSGDSLEGEACYDFMDEDDLGSVIKAGILAEYYSVIVEGKSRTSKRQRKRR